jgi:signal transduction histidine kinase
MNEILSAISMRNKTNQKVLNSNYTKRVWALKPFPAIINAPYGRKRMTAIVLRGTLILSLILISLLILNGLLVKEIQFTRIIIGVFITLYLIYAEMLVQHNKYLTGAWMVIVLYASVASAVLLTWSLNASIGILTIGFTVFLAGTLLSTKYISSVTIGTILILFFIQCIHYANIVTPDITALSKQSHFIDVLSYATVIGTFALLSWLSGKQTEHSIYRALKAEAKVKVEKNNLVQKLNEQSIALRQTQLQEMANLYKFASIGQSTTATLHELSNQLSVLTLDIDDLQLRHRQSTAIQNAKEGIDNINHLVRQTRKQLQQNQDLIHFNVIPIIERVINELGPKLNSKNVILHKNIPKRMSFVISGDPLNLSHVITILLNNAYDACILSKNSSIQITATESINTLHISIVDNGPGLIGNSYNLFQPHKSTKPNGLGIGLYITKQIIENQFKGKIRAKKQPEGAEFILSLPRAILKA